MKSPPHIHFTIAAKHGALLIMLLLSAFIGHAQSDSTDIYRKLQKRADKHEITRWIYDAIFVDPDDLRSDEDSAMAKETNTTLKRTNPFALYAKRPIRNVIVEVLDPFGYSVNDTLRHPSGRVQKLGNRYHVTTRKVVVRNLLLFKEGEKVDALKLSESERLLRQAPYVNDARIYIRSLSKSKKKKNNTDSVDVIVLVNDKWSLEPGSTFNSGVPDIILTENNFMGIGHQFRERVLYDRQYHQLGNAARYGIYNIEKTYVSAYINYYDDPIYTQLNVTLDRPFYSPLAKWAGGLSFSKTFGHYQFYNIPANQEVLYPLDYTSKDIWLGKSWQVGNSNTIKGRSSNIILGGRYINTIYQKRPDRVYDTTNVLYDQTLYLANLGFSRRQYYKERYVRRFGANEDIPLGVSAQLIGGYQKMESFSDMFYTGISVSAGHLFENGYLQATVTTGAFYNRFASRKGVTSIELFGFSNLIQYGRWYFRQFLRYKYLAGINRDPYEYLTLHRDEMYGFNDDLVRGQSKTWVNLETVMYTPYNIAGFRFAPIFMMGLGKVANTPAGLFSAKIYQAYSLGLLIRNENLLVNTFEISLAIYPYMPSVSGVSFLPGVTSNFDLRVRDFSVGKPDVLSYY